MSKDKKSTISVLGTPISILSQQEDDFISLTDMLKAKDGDFFISDWLRNRNTVEFLGIWERVHNPNFNYGEFATIKSQAGLNSYKISVKEWVAKTNAIGLRATTGRYGGTYAHKDIAFEFGMWISPEFKIYLIKEFQRLKEDESRRLSLDWNLNRTLAKLNYRIHTDAIKATLIPATVTQAQASFVYASEADVLNVALFGQTAKQWRDANPAQEGNMHEYATIEQLLILANIEGMNAELIRMGLSQGNRLMRLNEIAIRQLQLLTQQGGFKAIGGINDAHE
jgi:KilA-N domain